MGARRATRSGGSPAVGSRRGVVRATGQHVEPGWIERARAARRGATETEARAWEIVRDRRCLGLKFRRQQVIDGIRVDLYCASLRLVIELDGGVHDEPGQREYDALRSAMLETLGLRVVRIRNEDLSRECLERCLAGFLVDEVRTDR